MVGHARRNGELYTTGSGTRQENCGNGRKSLHTCSAGKDKRAGNVHFVYEEASVDKASAITLSYRTETPLDVILDDLCKQSKLRYELQGDIVLLYPIRKQRTYDVRVSLLDADNRQPLMMATCALNPLGAYAATDVDGKATLKSIPAGSYSLDISYVALKRSVAPSKSRKT
ncbi:hypothetical protein [Bacteroides reticulotermitis]|uniref:TonB-dependent receptor n=1 Tax=Bacteroides reticulotermitis JCM 10512 TaxID=1445607 RepID=W4UUR8_9BACE|nr:hypothetical protein [Bacteroides reticulotermitis]GAE84686.1 TonB-dependent receptor [Bacteroides reticulotermitis JCM 10512]